MSSTNFKRNLFAQFARPGEALNSSNRLNLLEFIAQGKRSAEDLGKAAGLTLTNTPGFLNRRLLPQPTLRADILCHHPITEKKASGKRLSGMEDRGFADRA